MQGTSPPALSRHRRRPPRIDLECLLEGGRIELRRPERSGVAFARTLSAAGARAQETGSAFDNRQIVNGILCRIGTGAPWRDLPEKYGKWMTVYQRFRRWSEAGIWEAVACPGDGRQLPPQPRFDDGSRSCLGCRRKRGTREQAFGRSRRGFTCKVQRLSDARGIPLVFHLTRGEAADCTAFEEVIALPQERPAYLLADKGYDSDAIRASLHEAGIRSCIPPKSNRRAKICWNRRMYRERNRIERMVGHLKINRAIATRYDKLARRSGPRGLVRVEARQSRATRRPASRMVLGEWLSARAFARGADIIRTSFGLECDVGGIRRC